jgi:hypothetical protein
MVKTWIKMLSKHWTLSTAAGSLECMGVYDGRFNSEQQKNAKWILKSKESFLQLTKSLQLGHCFHFKRKYLTYKLQKCVSFFLKNNSHSASYEIPCLLWNSSFNIMYTSSILDFSWARWNKATMSRPVFLRSILPICF